MTTCIPGFNGERLDPFSSTFQLGNGYRAYNPVLKRFHCPDSWSPFGHGGINPYTYCASDPVNRSDPSGHMSWQAGLGIGLGILGILGAVFTGGASIAAAGSISTALAGTSSLSLVVGTSALVADVTGIASTATEESDPAAATVLGWVSFATGMLSLGAEAATRGYRTVNKLTAGLRQHLAKIQKVGLSGGSRNAGQEMAKAGLAARRAPVPIPETANVQMGHYRTVSDKTTLLSTEGLSDCAALAVLTKNEQGIFKNRTLMHLVGGNLEYGLIQENATTMVNTLKMGITPGDKVIFVGGLNSQSNTSFVTMISQRVGGIKPLHDLFNIQGIDLAFAGSESINIHPNGMIQLRGWGGRGILSSQEIQDILRS